MFGLIGHLNSLEHAQAVAQELGYPGTPTRAGFFGAVPAVDTITVTSVTGQKIGRYVESVLPEMHHRRIKAANENH